MKNSRIISICTLVFGLSGTVTAVAKADLMVGHVTLDRKCRVVVRVRNTGAGNLTDKVWTRRHAKSVAVYLHVNGKPWGGRTVWSFNPGRSLRHLRTGSAIYRSRLVISGTKTVTIKIDHTNRIREDDEKNNTSRVKLTCDRKTGRLKPGTPLPAAEGGVR